MINDKEYAASGNYWKSNQVVKDMKTVSFQASEVPKEYYLRKYFSNMGGKYDSLLEKMRDERIIEFEISANPEYYDNSNLSTEEETRYLATEIAKDFSIITTEGDTVACIGAHFEHSNSLAPFKRLILYFDNIHSDKQLELLYRDYLYGKGDLKFHFNFTPVKL